MRRRQERGRRDGATGFRRLLAAATVSSLGDGIRNAALPLIALHLTASPLLITASVTANRLPWALAPLVGALVDRWDRRRTMIVTDVMRAACALFLAAALFSGRANLAMLCCVAFALGVGQVFFDTASIAVVPAITRRGRLDRSNARIISGETVANQFAGQPLGSVAVAASPSLPFLADALSFIASAVLLRKIRGRFTAARGEYGAGQGVLHDTLRGVRWLREHPTMRRLLVAVCLLGIAGGAVQATFVLLVRGLDGGDVVFGLVLAVGAMGSLAGAAASPWLLRRLGLRGCLTLSLALGTLAYTGLGAAPTLAFAACAFAVVGSTIVLWNVATLTARQRLIPDALLGRAQAAYRMVAWGSYPVGAVIGGVAVQHSGVRAPALLAATILLVLLPPILRLDAGDASLVDHPTLTSPAPRPR